MRLWTEYEGETIDGAFPLNKLLLPEGRSAIFSTANGNGDPAVLRLIECHFDEEEILARWRSVEALDHPNFLRLERYGQIELDGGAAVYALFEKVDANLAEVLAEGQLSVVDTAQLAASLVAALEMLHTHGFVHGHVTPENVFAVGEVVKLRSDCIREAREGQEGLDAKQRDVRDLTALVLQALTQQPAIAAEKTTVLPAPFDKIVRNGMNGTWGLTEMGAALGGRAQSSPAPAPRQGAAAEPPPARPPVASAASPVPPPAAAPREAAPAAKPASANPAAAKPISSRAGRTASWDNNVLRSSIRQDVWAEDREDRFALRRKWLGVAGMVAVVVLLAGWLLAHEWHKGRHGINHAAPAASSAPAPAMRRIAPPRPAAGGSAAAMHPAQYPERGGRAQWRVIAYTYNREDEAQKKAAAIARAHPDLRPAVFTPSGHSPYLVTVGGVMNRDAAYAFARNMRGRGLPRDTYAQNYNSTAR